MNIRDLRYLVAVAETRHFGHAAERCFVSQPTLSGQLKKLEQELGVQLVERSRRQVIVTAIGAEIVDRARKILLDIDELKDAARDQPGGVVTGSLHLGTIPTVGPYILPLITGPLRDRYPELELVLYEYQTSVLLQKIERGDLDLGILATPVRSHGLLSLDLYQEPFLVAVACDHPLAHNSEISAPELEVSTLLLLEEGHCLRGQALEVCTVQGRAREKADFRATSLETLRHMVAMNAGVTLMPRLAISDSTPADVCYIPFADPPPARQVGMMYRPTSARIETYRLLAEVIRGVVAQTVPEIALPSTIVAVKPD